MDKKTTQMIKGIAILIMLAHHFIVFSFSELPHGVMVFGAACKICVAIYAVLSGYGCLLYTSDAADDHRLV